MESIELRLIRLEEDVKNLESGQVVNILLKGQKQRVVFRGQSLLKREVTYLFEGLNEEEKIAFRYRASVSDGRLSQGVSCRNYVEARENSPQSARLYEEIKKSIGEKI